MKLNQRGNVDTGSIVFMIGVCLLITVSMVGYMDHKYKEIQKIQPSVITSDCKLACLESVIESYVQTTAEFSLLSKNIQTIKR
jgi:hypothetical protein